MRLLVIFGCVLAVSCGRESRVQSSLDAGPPQTDSLCLDADGDGVNGSGRCENERRVDCNDANPYIYPSANELCNGIDDTCEGLIDEGLAVTSYYVDGDGDGIGSRLAGQGCQAPDAGTVTVSGDCDDTQASVRPGAAEMCNGRDDDCDSRVDNGIPFTDFYPDADGDGFGDARGAAMVSCLAEVSGRTANRSDCDDQNPAVKPGVAEACNRIDDNCDGQVDNGLAVTVYYPDVDADGFGASGVTGEPSCTPVAGKVTSSSDCNDTNPAVKPGVPESCNSIDDNCSGVVDEGYAGVGQACSVGVGICQRSATLRCNAAGDAVACGASAAAPSVELCNGLDDDCNGVVDNGFAVGQSCSAGVGACSRSGATICALTGATTICSVTAGAPSTERCNGLDDDCDGTIDEDFTVGGACNAGVGACVRSGVVVCSPNGAATQCGATPGPATAERCNAIDDDCDGATDEDFTPGASCTSGLGPCSRQGSLVCNTAGTASVCNATPGAPTTEVCNGADDDCDGVVDDGIAGLGQSCSAGLGVCQRTGSTICNATGGTVCSVTAGPPTASACDGLDNDCDGVADEPSLKSTSSMSMTGFSDIEVQPYYFTIIANGGCNGGAATNSLPDALVGGAVVMSGGVGGIWFQPLAADGSPSGLARQVTTLNYVDVALAQAGQGFIVAGIYATTGAEIDIYFVDPTGQLLATKFFGFRGVGSPSPAIDSLRLVRGAGKRVTLVWRENGAGIKLGRVEPCLNGSNWELAQPGCTALTTTAGTGILTSTSTATIKPGLGADSNLIDWEPSQVCPALGTRRVAISYTVSFTGSTTVNEARLITVSESGTAPTAEVSINALAPPFTFTDTDVSFYRSAAADGWAVAYVKNASNDSDLLWWLSVNDNKSWPWLALATQNGGASIARPRVSVTNDRIWWAASRWVNDATSSKRQVMTRVSDIAGTKVPVSTAVEVAVTQGACGSDADCRPGDKGAFSTWAPFGRAYFSATGASPAGSFSSRLTCD